MKLKINFRMFYDKSYCDTPINFENIINFKQYLFDNINENNIECLETCEFEIKNKYEY